MDHALFVGDLECGGDLPCDVEGVVERKRPALELLGEVFAGHVLHRDEGDPLVLVQAVDGRDPAVVQRGQQPRLAFEARAPVGIVGERGGEDLDRHVAVERRIPGLPDHTHSALADLFDEPVVRELGSGFNHAAPILSQCDRNRLGSIWNHGAAGPSDSRLESVSRGNQPLARGFEHRPGSQTVEIKTSGEW